MLFNVASLMTLATGLVFVLNQNVGCPKLHTHHRPSGSGGGQQAKHRTRRLDQEERSKNKQRHKKQNEAKYFDCSCREHLKVG